MGGYVQGGIVLCKIGEVYVRGVGGGSVRGGELSGGWNVRDSPTPNCNCMHCKSILLTTSLDLTCSAAAAVYRPSGFCCCLGMYRISGDPDNPAGYRPIRLYPVSGRKYPVVFPNIASENRVKIGPELAEKRVKVA